MYFDLLESEAEETYVTLPKHTTKYAPEMWDVGMQNVAVWLVREMQPVVHAYFMCWKSTNITIYENEYEYVPSKLELQLPLFVLATRPSVSRRAQYLLQAFFVRNGHAAKPKRWNTLKIGCKVHTIKFSQFVFFPLFPFSECIWIWIHTKFRPTKTYRQRTQHKLPAHISGGILGYT